jgi:hypothetical protein
MCRSVVLGAACEAEPAALPPLLLLLLLLLLFLLRGGCAVNAEEPVIATKEEACLFVCVRVCVFMFVCVYVSESVCLYARECKRILRAWQREQSQRLYVLVVPERHNLQALVGTITSRDAGSESPRLSPMHS